MMIPIYSVSLPKAMACDREKTQYAEEALKRILELCQTDQRDADFVLSLEDSRAIWVYKFKNSVEAA